MLTISSPATRRLLGPSPSTLHRISRKKRHRLPRFLSIKEVWVEDRRYVVCLNEEERRKDAYDREAIVAHLKEQLRSGDKSLVGNKGYRRYLKVQGSGHFVIDEDQVKAEERYDGIWVLRTNTVYNAETVAHVYKALWTVEDIIRTAKSILETRSIYHKCNETIRGHVFCSFLRLMERLARGRAVSGWSPANGNSGAPHPRTARASPSISSACAEMTHFITSRIETIPIIFVPSRTGRWRTSFSVITRILSAVLSLGLAVNTSRVMISLTGVSFEDSPFRITFRV